LLIVNLVFLFCISLFPLAMSFVFTGREVFFFTWGVATYIIIVYLASLAQALLTGYVVLLACYLQWTTSVTLSIFPGISVIQLTLTQRLYPGRRLEIGPLLRERLRRKAHRR
jgi:hypothetical protein